MTGWGQLGTSDPVYDLELVRVHKTTGVVEQISLSREALRTLGVHEGEWRPSILLPVPAHMKLVRRPKPRVKPRVMPDDAHDQLDDPWNQPPER